MFANSKKVTTFASAIEREILDKKDGPFVYRLGRKIFILERGVRFPHGLRKKRLSQNETAFFVFAKKIGQVLTSLSQNLPVSLIFCILGNQVKISQR